MKWLDAPVPPVEEIHRRLRIAIPPELDPRGWVRREMGARVVFVLLYGQAVEGEGRWIRPTAVTDMTDEQAKRQEPEERRAWLDLVQSPGRPRNVRGSWYEENTREPIRDETIGVLLELGAIAERSGLPTTSPRPRYALTADFARLFSSELPEPRIEEAIRDWQEKNLRREDLARIELLRRGLGDEEHPLVRLPTGETRRLAPGPSTDLTREVVESFAPRFLGKPAVILISESARKLMFHDRELARKIGFDVDPASTLPDLLLVDLAVTGMLFVFVEVVHTDGEINRRRKEELLAIAEQGGIPPHRCAFVSAFRDRSSGTFRKVSSSLAWDSFAWFSSEPHNLLHLRQSTAEESRMLAALLDLKHPP